MKRSLLLLGALIALLILTRTPGPRETVARALPGRSAWQRAEQILVEPAPPAPEVYAAIVRDLEIACGDPAGGLFIERTLRRWPDFEPARRARAMQAVRHGQAPAEGGSGDPMRFPARRSACE
jgi:hypothetical protein